MLNSTWPAETDDTPSAVGSTPEIAHGWRPYSATIQPSSIASHGSGRLYNASFRYQRLASSRRLLASQNEYANRTMKYMPQATMMRNDQNSTGTFGIVLSAARRMSAGVALAGSSRLRRSNSA